MRFSDAADFDQGTLKFHNNKYLKFIYVQAKFPVLKQVVGVDADTSFVRDKLSPVGARE